MTTPPAKETEMPSRKLWIAVLSVAVALCLAPTTASATIITVNDPGDDPPNAGGINGNCTLREAIQTASTGAIVDNCTQGDNGAMDTITFNGGVTPIVLDETGAADNTNIAGDLDIISQAAGLAIDGSNAGGVTIDATGVAERVIDHQNVTPGLLELRELTIRDGSDTFGGGILQRGGSLELEDSTVTGNTATSSGGGGVNVQSGANATIDNSTISNNTVTTNDGAGIDSTGTLVVQGGSVISGNQATADATSLGGGISHADTGDLTVSASTVTNNDAGDRGGGIQFASTGALLVSNSVISLNEAGGSASGGGGGIAISSTPFSVTIDDSEISGNQAGVGTGNARQGGGIDNNTNTGPLVSDSLVANNTSTGSGGGINTRNSSSLTLLRSVVTGNQVTAPANTNVSGGGIDKSSSNAGAITDSLIANNSVTTSGTGDADGGGARLAGTGGTTINGTTFSGNTATGGDTHRGGGVFLANTAQHSFFNATFSGNSVVGAGGDGGGLYATGIVVVNLNNATFTGNTAAGTGDGIFESVPVSNLASTIVDDGCSGDPADIGGNLVHPASCGFTDGGDPMLNPLRDNGGPGIGRPGDLRALLVHDLNPASPAVDFLGGNCVDHNAVNVTVDERGFSRPFDGDGDMSADCDAGAYELHGTCQNAGVTQEAATIGDDFLQGDDNNAAGVNRRDVINGLAGDDIILGLDGDDVLCGDTDLAGDTLTPGPGDDVVDGGTGAADLVTFGNATASVTANLTTGQATGEGTDTLSTLENLSGSPQGDILTGNGVANAILGGASTGNDVLSGGGGAGPDGNDSLDGGGNTATGDTVTYSTRNDAIGADLGTDVGGDLGVVESDTIANLENATGGNGGDTLTGDGAANVLTGLGGNDTLNGLGLIDTLVLGAGTNTVTSNDGAPDTINCTGGGPNTGTVDTAPAETYVACDFDGDSVVDFLDACPTQAGTLANGCPAPVVTPPAATPAPTPTATPPAPVKKCKKGQKLKKGKCVKKRRKK